MRKKLFDYFIFGCFTSGIGSFTALLVIVVGMLFRKLFETSHHIIDILLLGLIIMIIVAIIILINIFLGFYIVHGLKKDGSRFKW